MLPFLRWRLPRFLTSHPTCPKCPNPNPVYTCTPNGKRIGIPCFSSFYRLSTLFLLGYFSTCCATTLPLLRLAPHTLPTASLPITLRLGTPYCPCLLYSANSRMIQQNSPTNLLLSMHSNCCLPPKYRANPTLPFAVKRAFPPPLNASPSKTP